MAGPKKYTELIAERHAIADVLADIPGDTNLEKLKAYQQMQEDAIAALALRNKALTEELGGVATSGTPEPVVDAPIAEPGLSPSTRYPLDAAQYPKPGTYTAPVLAGPQMSPIEGDLTPSYVRWFVNSNGPDATREKYGERIPLLPEDVRRAIA